MHRYDSKSAVSPGALDNESVAANAVDSADVQGHVMPEPAGCCMRACERALKRQSDLLHTAKCTVYSVPDRKDANAACALR
jgi:hypothetical protein